MKPILSGTIYIILMVSIGSCSTTLHSGTAKTRNIRESAIAETFNIADLKVDEQKVTGTRTGYGQPDEIIKNLAVYEALKKVNADVLIEPSYDIEKTGNSTTVTVQGFPGFYKNFRRPSAKDSIIIGWKINSDAPGNFSSQGSYYQK